MRPEAVAALVAAGAHGAGSLQELAGQLRPGRVFWLMLPAALVDEQIEQLPAAAGGRRYCGRWRQLVLPRRFAQGGASAATRHRSMSMLASVEAFGACSVAIAR